MSSLVKKKIIVQDQKQSLNVTIFSQVLNCIQAVSYFENALSFHGRHVPKEIQNIPQLSEIEK